MGGWRLIPPMAGAGSMQMAIDSWLLDQHAQGILPPTLRFYTWDPPAISLGYHQRQYPNHWNHLIWNDRPLECVRRPTGGRAVLHQGDLTYAVITSGLTGNRLQTYQALCEFLIVGWRSLGVDLHFGTAGRGYIHNPNCFGSATGADLITADGIKWVGSAQVYRDRALLQHGSMPLWQDPDLFEQVFGSPPRPILGDYSIEAIAQALCDAARSCFLTTFTVQPLSLTELTAVHASLAIEAPMLD